MEDQEYKYPCAKPSNVLKESSNYKSGYHWLTCMVIREPTHATGNKADTSTKYTDTLAYTESSSPRSLINTTPAPTGYPWISGGRYKTPQPRIRGLVLNHQGLEELELKNHQKTAVFDQIWLFLSGFLVLVLLKADGWAPNPYIWVLGSHTDPKIPMGTWGRWSSF